VPPQPGVPAPDFPEKKFNSRLVAPTVFSEKLFGVLAGELRRCWERSYGSMSVFN